MHLEEQKIDGETLLDMTKEDLERYGIPGGPATKLFKAIQQLNQEPGTYLSTVYFALLLCDVCLYAFAFSSSRNVLAFVPLLSSFFSLLLPSSPFFLSFLFPSPLLLSSLPSLFISCPLWVCILSLSPSFILAMLSVLRPSFVPYSSLFSRCLLFCSCPPLSPCPLLTNFKVVRIYPGFGRHFLQVKSNWSPLMVSLSVCSQMASNG